MTTVPISSSSRQGDAQSMSKVWVTDRAMHQLLNESKVWVEDRAMLKRVNLIEKIMQSPHYKLIQDHDEALLPELPNALDRFMSKRSWERACFYVRQGLGGIAMHDVIEHSNTK